MTNILSSCSTYSKNHLQVLFGVKFLDRLEASPFRFFTFQMEDIVRYTDLRLDIFEKDFESERSELDDAIEATLEIGITYHQHYLISEV